MRHISIISIILLMAFAFSCGDKSQKQEPSKVETPEVKEELTKEEPKEVGKRDTMEDSRDLKGVGKFTNVELAAIDPERVKAGEEKYKAVCEACHKMETRLVGPALGGLTKRRSPEWILNMITNPEQMIKEDPIGIALLKEYLAPMVSQNITDEEAYNLLDYFRQYDKK